MSTNLIVSKQIRAARALLGWSQQDLAKTANLGIATVRRFEVSTSVSRGNIETLIKLQRALEKGGIQFIDQDSQAGYGVRLKSGTHDKDHAKS